VKSRATATSPRGFPDTAKRATIAGMSWHPKDDAWKQAHLAMLVKLGKRAWLHCDGCRHSVMIALDELAQRHRLDMLTPLLTISRAMRCTRCGARKGCCWPEPHKTEGPVVQKGTANGTKSRDSQTLSRWAFKNADLIFATRIGTN
jgi:hypothetical protein